MPWTITATLTADGGRMVDRTAADLELALVVGIGLSASARPLLRGYPAPGRNRKLTLGPQLFLRVVHATVGLCPIGLFGGARTPRIAWTSEHA
jgi:hypothetical protein